MPPTFLPHGKHTSVKKGFTQGATWHRECGERPEVGCGIWRQAENFLTSGVNSHFDREIRWQTGLPKTNVSFHIYKLRDRCVGIEDKQAAELQITAYTPTVGWGRKLGR